MQSAGVREPRIKVKSVTGASLVNSSIKKPNSVRGFADDFGHFAHNEKGSSVSISVIEQDLLLRETERIETQEFCQVASIGSLSISPLI